MKIALIKNKIPFPCANVINTLKHAQALYNLGNNIEVLAVERIIEEIWRLKLKDVHFFYDLDSNIKIKYFRGNFLYFFNNFKFLGPALKLLKKIPKVNGYMDPELQISNYCIKNEIDLAYSRGTPYAAYNNIMNKIPTIIETHFYHYFPALKRVLELSKNKYFLGVVTISNILKQSLMKQRVPEEKILVLDDAVELKKFNTINLKKSKLKKMLNFPLHKNIILYTGNLGPGRGIDTIISSLKFLDEKEYCFYIIGGDPFWFKYWKKYIKKRRIKADIKFLGFTSIRNIPYYIKAADILIAPYTKDCYTINWMSPVKLFEYMASKVPIIASNVQRIKEICSNNECLFFKAGDSRDLSEKIKILINDRELQEKLTKNAIKKAEKHTYIKRSQKILELFNKSFLM